jgi:hypothetical protein
MRAVPGGERMTVSRDAPRADFGPMLESERESLQALHAQAAALWD